MRTAQIHFTSQEINRPDIFQNITDSIHKANGPRFSAQNTLLLLAGSTDANSMNNHTETSP
ncbi:hypothetical protein [Thalassomonas actiniarum]|uniref:Uncharacterized protein n=1 Tax=Thalassomonas actiniarum TaxID=485447 RepID=A0AAE9YUV9_9GAMM|nr:hypothetical protein [Thalassomonas actiniarum]WDE00755.1 hypothetical protein SG35_009040 [Thalassomonas actiniarum]